MYYVYISLAIENSLNVHLNDRICAYPRAKSSSTNAYLKLNDGLLIVFECLRKSAEHELYIL